MKQPQTFRSITLAVAIAGCISLSACGTDPAGDINSGIDGGFSGSVSSNPLILAGGVIGIAGIIDSSGGGTLSVPVVESQTGDSSGGTDSGDNSSGSDDSDSSDASDSGNNDSGNNNQSDAGDNDSDSDQGSDAGNSADDNSANDDSEVAGPVNGSFEPPAWMNGMWQGTGADGESVIVYATTTDIGVGDKTNVPSYSAIEGISSQTLQSTERVYEYTVRFQSDKGVVHFTEKWTNNGDGTALYTASGDRHAEFIVYRAAATDFLMPPQWLQGEWSGNHYRVRVAANNIKFGSNSDEPANLKHLASRMSSILLVRQNTKSHYSLELLTRGEDGNYHSALYSFSLSDNNTVAFNSTSPETSVVLIRH